MKAIIVEKPFEIAVREVPAPQIRNDGEVLIQVLYGGICGSDIGIYNGTNSLATYPRVIGHEFGGRVVEVGKNVKNVATGSAVAVDPVVSCGHCYACNHNRHNVCREVEVIGVHRDGGFAEYVAVPAENCHAVDVTRIPEKWICMVEPFSIGVQVNHRGEISANDTVLVMGSGPIGLCVLQVAKSRGARVLITDLVDGRLALAKRCGADRTVNVQKEDLAAAVSEFTGGEGVSVSVDSICTLTSVPQAMELTCPAGRVVVLGLKDKASEIAQVAFTKKELTVLGSRLNNHRFPEVIEMFASGRLHPELLQSALYPFEQVEDAIRLIREYPEHIAKVSLAFAEK